MFKIEIWYITEIIVKFAVMLNIILYIIAIILHYFPCRGTKY